VPQQPSELAPDQEILNVSAKKGSNTTVQADRKIIVLNIQKILALFDQIFNG